MKGLTSLVALAAFGAAVCLSGAGHVSAHAGFVSSNPTDKQVLAAEPAQISMTFAQNLAAAPGSFIYVSTGGNDASAGASAISASDTRTMTIPLKSGLSSGQFSVFWKTTSADDSGVTFGRFTFFVGAAPSDVAAAAAGASVAVPDAATDMAVSAGGMNSVTLAAGCTMVALTFDDNTPAATVAAAVSPAGTVTIYKYDSSAGAYATFSTAGGASDLKTVNHLDAVWICTAAAGTLMEPAA